MKKIAALYTCHNRKEKTLASLRTLYKAKNAFDKPIVLDVYITDDGSTDGTANEVLLEFPKVNVSYGNGSLFWAEGMRESWKNALQKEYDGFLLLNDDVEIYQNMFVQLFNSHDYCLRTFNKAGIYIGATEDKIENKLTYSGSIILNRLLYTQKRLPPNGEFQKCDLANANIMLVTHAVVKKIGILSEGYSHGMADYDYTLLANRNNIPVLVAPSYCGHCRNDHKDKYEGFENKSFTERKELLYSPTGLAYDSYLKYMRKFFPFRYPLVAIMGQLKLYFPNLYVKFFIKR